MSSAVTTIVLAAIPSPDRGVWYLGPVPIRAYALCIIAGIVVAVLWGERRFVARGGEPGTVTDVAVFAVPFGLVGGRLYHVVTDWQNYFGPGGNPVDALKIWQGGLGIWGAVALGAVGRLDRLPAPRGAAAVLRRRGRARASSTAQAIGRLGNWFNQELYGAPDHLPWGLEIYRRVNPETGAPDSLGGVALDHTPIEVVHPTFLYELLWNLAVAGSWCGPTAGSGSATGGRSRYTSPGYTAGRFLIEQMRTDDATRVFGDLRINVVVSAVVFVGAVLYLVLVRRPREVLPTAADAGSESPTGDGELVPVAAGAGRASGEETVGPSDAAAGTAHRRSVPTVAEPGAASAGTTGRPVDDPSDPGGEVATPDSTEPGSADGPPGGLDDTDGTPTAAEPADAEPPADGPTGAAEPAGDAGTGAGASAQAEPEPADGPSGADEPAAAPTDTAQRARRRHRPQPMPRGRDRAADRSAGGPRADRHPGPR